MQPIEVPIQHCPLCTLCRKLHGNRGFYANGGRDFYGKWGFYAEFAIESHRVHRGQHAICIESPIPKQYNP